MTLVFLALSCRSGGAPSPQTAPVVAAADVAVAVPAMPPAGPEVGAPFTLDLLPSELSYDEGAGTVTFSPGRSVQSARYTDYVIDLTSLETILGGRPEAPTRVVVDVLGHDERTYLPDDPNVAQPDGGFLITTWTCTVTGVEGPG